MAAWFRLRRNPFKLRQTPHFKERIEGEHYGLADFGSALIGASAAIIVGFGLEHIRRRKEASGVAGALAGEIASIIANSETAHIDKIFELSIQLLEKDWRVERRAGTRIEHYTPVFDRVSDRIGLLPWEIGRNIVMFYNELWSFRSGYSDLITGHYDSPEHKEHKLSVVKNLKLKWTDCTKNGHDVLKQLSDLYTRPWWTV